MAFKHYGQSHITLMGVSLCKTIWKPGVHNWFADAFGHAVPPLSLGEAVASWPETATSVGIRLNSDDTISVIAPLGLQDRFGLVIRRNPARVSVATYRQRIRDKRYNERWPLVRILEE